MSKKKEAKIEIGSGNVFVDLGRPNAEELTKKSETIRNINARIDTMTRLKVTGKAMAIPLDDLLYAENYVSYATFVLDQLKNYDKIMKSIK